MQSTHDTPESLPSGVPKPAPMYPTPDTEKRMAFHEDKEIFLKKAFEDDPKKGCELLFKQYYQPLCSHAVRFVYSKEIAQDIVGDLFYVFWQKQLYRDITTSFRAYLFIAVRNRALKHLRQEFGRTNDVVGVMDLDVMSDQPSPQQILQFDELSSSIEKGIQALPPQRQKVFIMNRFEGRKYHEIAAQLKVSVKTVEAHMSRALEALRKVVRDESTLLIIMMVFFS